MKRDKYYINAYNNPNQYSVDGFKNKKELTDVQNSIVKGITDAHIDRQNGTYRFKN